MNIRELREEDQPTIERCQHCDGHGYTMEVIKNDYSLPQREWHEKERTAMKDCPHCNGNGVLIREIKYKKFPKGTLGREVNEIKGGIEDV